MVFIESVWFIHWSWSKFLSILTFSYYAAIVFSWGGRFPLSACQVHQVWCLHEHLVCVLTSSIQMVDGCDVLIGTYYFPLCLSLTVTLAHVRWCQLFCTRSTTLTLLAFRLTPGQLWWISVSDAPSQSWLITCHSSSRAPRPCWSADWRRSVREGVWVHCLVTLCRIFLHLTISFCAPHIFLHLTTPYYIFILPYLTTSSFV